MSSASTIIDQAELLAKEGRPDQAVALLEGGDAEALFTLAVWLDSGRWLDRDRHRARALFGRAADAGHGGADTICTNFLGNGTGGPRNWAAAVERLRKRSAEDDRAAFELDLIEQMALDEKGNPTEIAADEELSASPVIRLIPGLLSEGECAYLAVAATP